ncbi:MAG: sugar kinase [Clostridia bacterium]|nr:sugar kinase [Clostridia bacterium]
MIRNLPKRSYAVLGMGEVMLRLSPIGRERLSYSEAFEKRAGGSELNVVSGISMLGLRTGMITKLPRNEIGKFIKHKIRFTGTSDDYVVYDDSRDMRLGIYYYESGAYPRLPVVSYDRQGSSVTRFSRSELSPDVYESANIFHTSGITLALSRSLCDNVIAMMEEFHNAGALISFDVNYRAALWSEEEARATVGSILPLVDILFISEETSRRMLGMSGSLEEIQRDISKRYPNLKIIASTMRRVISAQKHSFTSRIYDVELDESFTEAEYRNIEVVDRIGSGDAYVAGALYGLLRFGDIASAARYGNAMAALKNTVPGDMSECDLADIEMIIKNHTASGPRSEMVR